MLIDNLRSNPLPTRTLGKTGVEVSIFGLGGEGILRTWDKEREAIVLIRRAVALGVTYFDCAHAYAGSEDYHGKVWGEDPQVRQKIFLCSKSAERTAQGASAQLERTLQRMRTEYLDLWQVHDLRTEREWQQLLAPGGALEAFARAREQGKVRFLGVTGHHNPALLTRALKEFAFDTVLLPVNAAEDNLQGFNDETLETAVAKGMGIIGMKVLGAGQYPQAGYPVGPLLRYALQRPVSTIVVGCGSPEELEANLKEVQTLPDSGEAAEIVALMRAQAQRAANYRGVVGQLV